MKTLKLRSSDGVDFYLDLKAARLSIVFQNMLKVCDLGSYEEESSYPSDDEEDTPVVEKADADTLKKVIQWLDHHKDDDLSKHRDGEHTDDTIPVSEWDAKFISEVKDEKDMLKLLLAADFLYIPRLLDLTCKTVAGFVEGKTAEEFRKDLHKTVDEKQGFNSNYWELIRKEVWVRGMDKE